MIRPHRAVRAGLALSLLAIVSLAGAGSARSAPLPAPGEFLGLAIGADRVLADHRQIRRYFAELDRRSPRVQVETLGKSTLGEDMIMAVISSEENLARLPRLKEIAKRLADPRGLSDAEIAALAAEGRAFVLVTCNIHATEIGASQMAMEWAHALAGAEDAETRRRLDQVVLLLVPSLNPDGQIMETEWYRKHLGTKYEGGRMPWLYHPYVGHDNNRDWYMLTQAETRAMTRAVYHEWFPQVWLDEHQMGSTGPRIFVPPYAEPVDPDIHPLVWREVNLMGANMALRLEQAGKQGVIYGYSYDAYWPGGTKNTAWFKNVSGLLTEVASVRIATPLEVDPGELAGGRKGLIENGAQTNYPNPWPGGRWTLRDIMDYERIASDALLESCADLREDLLRNVATRAKAAIALARPGEAFHLPRRQHDWPAAVALGRLMLDHAVEVHADASGLWIPLEQPYGNFVREMLTTQRYPEVKLVAGKDIVRPYDVAAWSLPLQMGVAVERGTTPAGAGRWSGEALAGDAGAAGDPGTPAAFVPQGPHAAAALNAALRKGRVWIAPEGYRLNGREWPAGTAFLDAAAADAARPALAGGVALEPLGSTATASLDQAGAPAAQLPRDLAPARAPRVGLYKPWAASMDEGWTRFVLERHGFEPTPLDNPTVQKGRLEARFDAIVLPDVPREVIATGKPRRDEGQMSYFVELPPPYAGGLGDAGARSLREFVEAGGTLVAMASSCEWVIQHFNVPVVNALARVKPEEFGCPGSLLRAHVNPHPVTRGLPQEVALFVDEALAFQTAVPGGEMDRWVLARYPDDEPDVLLSGWMTGQERIVKRAAAVALTYGRGRIVLLGFRPQHRAQTPGTFPFLFNALLWSTAK